MKHQFTKEEISKYFHLPLEDAAKELGVCASVLKRSCRNHGIKRWPYRKIKSLAKKASMLETAAKSTSTQFVKLQSQIDELQKQKQEYLHTEGNQGTSGTGGVINIDGNSDSGSQSSSQNITTNNIAPSTTTAVSNSNSNISNISNISNNNSLPPGNTSSSMRLNMTFAPQPISSYLTPPNHNGNSGIVTTNGNTTPGINTNHNNNNNINGQFSLPTADPRNFISSTIDPSVLIQHTILKSLQTLDVSQLQNLLLQLNQINQFKSNDNISLLQQLGGAGGLGLLSQLGLGGQGGISLASLLGSNGTNILANLLQTPSLLGNAGIAPLSTSNTSNVNTNNPLSQLSLNGVNIPGGMSTNNNNNNNVAGIPNNRVAERYKGLMDFLEQVEPMICLTSCDGEFLWVGQGLFPYFREVFGENVVGKKCYDLPGIRGSQLEQPLREVSFRLPPFVDIDLAVPDLHNAPTIMWMIKAHARALTGSSGRSFAALLSNPNKSDLLNQKQQVPQGYLWFVTINTSIKGTSNQGATMSNNNNNNNNSSPTTSTSDAIPTDFISPTTHTTNSPNTPNTIPKPSGNVSSPHISGSTTAGQF